MALLSDKEREALRKENDERLKQEFQEWVKIQEDMGFTVVGDSWENAQVVEAPKGPTYDDTPGA